MGQRNEIFSEDIKTLQVIAGNRWMDIPVVSLNGNEAIHISFDDMTHEYRRYTYKIEHCEADWTTSEELLASDFVEGFSEGNTIDDLLESLNTTMLYTHYSIRIPNNKCRLKMSGNYRLTVCDDNDDDRPVLSSCFMVKEDKMGVRINVETNTDVNINERHQQVEMVIDYGSLPVIRHEEQVKTVVMQNGRWDNARMNVKPQFIKSDGLRWSHCRDLIFTAGNEFRKFEMTSVKTAMMGVDNIKWFRPFYHATLFTAEDQSNYIYNEDQNGKYYIRTSEYNVDETEADYIWVHFFLKHKQEPNGKLYVYGGLTNWCIIPDAEMKYNNESQLYECALLLKEGYYNYQYMYVPTGQRIGDPSLVDGNYYQTENEYTILVYYTQRGSRYDRLVGYRQFRFAPSL
jgi:hypothetical protein